MSLEQAIFTHAAAISELAAAILKTSSTLHQVGNMTVIAPTGDDKKADAKPDPKPAAAKNTPPAEKKADATAKPGADQKASAGASSTLSYDDIKVKILELAKAPDEGKEKCGALLDRFGVKKGPDLKESQWEEFHGLITRVIAGEYDPRDGEPNAETEDDAMA